jgi:glycosyltransferase involved in cell wall biosynthesis
MDMPASRDSARGPRIALFAGSLAGGGAERVIAILAQEFAKRGCKVDLVLRRATGQYLPEIPPSVRIVDLRASRAATSLLPLAKYLRGENPDCLLATLTHVNLIAVLAHQLARSRARLVLREATTLSLASRNAHNTLDRVLPYLARIAYPRADKVVAVSKGVAADLHTVWGIPLEKIEVVYNPLITDGLEALAAQPAEHPWLGDPVHPLVLAVGRLTRAKNYPLLLRSFARLRQRIPARLLILGEGEEREALLRLARELELEPYLDMPGFVRNPFSYMARASMLVLASSWEGLPGVLIQAMACGCPVVSTDCPNGPSEILDNGRFGRIVPMDDLEALCEGMLAALRGELQPADSNWLEQFSAERVTEHFLRILGVETS